MLPFVNRKREFLMRFFGYFFPFGKVSLREKYITLVFLVNVGYINFVRNLQSQPEYFRAADEENVFAFEFIQSLFQAGKPQYSWRNFVIGLSGDDYVFP